MSGLALYLACTVAAAMAVALGRPMPGADAQRRVKGLLSLGALYLGAAVAYAGMGATGRPWWRCLALMGAAMLVGNAVGVATRFQKGSNALARWATARLGPGVPAPRFCASLAVVLGLNPVGWMAGLLAGLAGDWRPLVFKGLLDGLGVWSAGAGRPASAALSAALVAAGQGGLLWLGVLLRQRLEGTDAAALFAVASGAYLAVLPVVLMGIARVSLANLFLGLPTGLLLAWWWR